MLCVSISVQGESTGNRSSERKRLTQSKAELFSPPASLPMLSSSVLGAGRATQAPQRGSFHLQNYTDGFKQGI